MGVNLPFIDYVIHVGVPPNMSVWLQVLGRAGRNGQQDTAIMIVNEHYDMQRLYYWLKEIKSEELRKEKERDFTVVYQFIYNV